MLPSCSSVLAKHFLASFSFHSRVWLEWGLLPKEYSVSFLDFSRVDVICVSLLLRDSDFLSVAKKRREREEEEERV